MTIKHKYEPNILPLLNVKNSSFFLVRRGLALGDLDAALSPVQLFVGRARIDLSGAGDLRGALFERGLATVVAIERFRRTEGHLPASLAELRPRFVDEVPKDPFRKGPFVYRVLPLDPTAAWHPGYTLWSVGVNGSDDGGSWRSDVVLVPLPPEPEPEPSADSPAAPDATLGN